MLTASLLLSSAPLLGHQAGVPLLLVFHAIGFSYMVRAVVQLMGGWFLSRHPKQLHPVVLETFKGFAVVCYMLALWKSSFFWFLTGVILSQAGIALLNIHAESFFRKSKGDMLRNQTTLKRFDYGSQLVMLSIGAALGYFFTYGLMLLFGLGLLVTLCVMGLAWKQYELLGWKEVGVSALRAESWNWFKQHPPVLLKSVAFLFASVFPCYWLIQLPSFIDSEFATLPLVSLAIFAQIGVALAGTAGNYVLLKVQAFQSLKTAVVFMGLLIPITLWMPKLVGVLALALLYACFVIYFMSTTLVKSDRQLSLSSDNAKAITGILLALDSLPYPLAAMFKDHNIPLVYSALISLGCWGLAWLLSRKGLPSPVLSLK